MPQIELREKGCRGCEMCVDICPTDVYAYDEQKNEATVREQDDCIACLSCVYLCPSGAIKISDYQPVKNFYRDVAFSRCVSRFL